MGDHGLIYADNEQTINRFSLKHISHVYFSAPHIFQKGNMCQISQF